MNHSPQYRQFLISSKDKSKNARGEHQDQNDGFAFIVILSHQDDHAAVHRASLEILGTPQPSHNCHVKCWCFEWPKPPLYLQVFGSDLFSFHHKDKETSCLHN
jgi:hypothetical protein